MKDQQKATTAGICSCVAVAFAITALISPYLVWSRYNATAGLGVGIFIPSRILSGSVISGSGFVAFVGGQTLRYHGLSDSVCSTAVKFNNETFNNYDDWANEYGFCNDGPNGAVNTPKQAKVIQAFTILTVVFAIFSSIAGCSFTKRRSKLIGAVAAFFATLFSIVAFAQATTWNYIQDLRSGTGYIPLVSNDVIVGLRTTESLVYGPSFFTLVFVFILMLYSTIGLCASVKHTTLAEDDDVDDLQDDQFKDTELPVRYTV